MERQVLLFPWMCSIYTSSLPSLNLVQSVSGTRWKLWEQVFGCRSSSVSRQTAFSARSGINIRLNVDGVVWQVNTLMTVLSDGMSCGKHVCLSSCSRLAPVHPARAGRNQPAAVLLTSSCRGSDTCRKSRGNREREATDVHATGCECLELSRCLFREWHFPQKHLCTSSKRLASFAFVHCLQICRPSPLISCCYVSSWEVEGERIDPGCEHKPLSFLLQHVTVGSNPTPLSSRFYPSSLHSPWRGESAY